MRIGEVARRSGVSVRMLRHYESLGLVAPSRRSSAGYREYSADDVVRIFHVEALRALGLPLAAVGRALDDPAFTPDAVIADLAAATRDRIARETELLQRLEDVAATGAPDWERVIDTVAMLSALSSPDPSARQTAALTDGGVSGEVLVRALLDEDDPNTAGALSWALVRSGDDSVIRLAESLRSDDVGVRRRVVDVLVETDGPESTAGLAVAAADADSAVRARAVLELARRGDQTVVPALIDLVVDGYADVAAGEAIGALAHRGEAEGIVAALDACRGDGVDVRRRVVQALGEIDHPAAMAALAASLGDPDPGVAFTARYLLARSDG